MANFIADHIDLALPAAGTDAALLQAWEDYKSACRAYEAVQDEALTTDTEDKFAEVFTEAEHRIVALPATTLEGVAVKLRLALVGQMHTGDQGAALRDGWLPAIDDCSEDIAVLHQLSALLDVERMIAGTAIETRRH